MHIRAAVVLPVLLLALGPGFLLTPRPANPQVTTDTTRMTIVGHVVDAITREPLRNVVLRIPTQGVTEVSDAEGDFPPVRIPSGAYPMSLSRFGYRVVEGVLTVQQAGSFLFELLPLNRSISGDSSHVTGTVTDGETDRTLEASLVAVDELKLVRLTDSQGRFDLAQLPPGVWVLRVEHLGYATREDSVFIPPGESVELRVQLGPQPIPLEGFTISVEPRNRELELEGFYQRRDWGLGRQWTRQQIEEERALFLADLIRKIPGLEVVREGFMTKVYSRRRVGLPRDPTARMPDRCQLAVYVDGMKLEDFDIDSVDPLRLQAFEVYHGVSETPIQYAHHCGVMLLWLRH
jgi:hypothetical protein